MVLYWEQPYILRMHNSYLNIQSTWWSEAEKWQQMEWIFLFNLGYETQVKNILAFLLTNAVNYEQKFADVVNQMNRKIE